MAYINIDKLRRAQVWAKEHGKAGDEDTIRERYVSLGGLIAEQEPEDAGAEAVQPKAALPKPKKPKAA